MSDRHYYEGLPPRALHRTCKQCGRPFKGRWGAKYGSPACRKAASRAKHNPPADLAEANEAGEPQSMIANAMRAAITKYATKGGAA